MSTVLPASLFAVALGLGAAVVYQAAAPVPPLAEGAADTAYRPPAVTLPAAYDPPPEDRFAVINDRPLFDPARQPVAEPQIAGTQSVTPPDLTLIGVAIGGGASIALLKKADAPASLSVRLGETIDGWKLVHIEPGFVVFHAGASDYTVPLRVAKGIPQPPLSSATPNSTLPNPTPAQPGQ
jgi:hypothetical protein